MSKHLCLAVCCLECQYFQCFSWSSRHFSSPNTTITTLWRHEEINQSCAVRKRLSRFSSLGLSSHPDFGDGLLQAFVVDLPEGDGVELAFVQVRHGAVTRLLPQRLGRLQGVLEIIPATRSGVRTLAAEVRSARFSFDGGLQISVCVCVCANARLSHRAGESGVSPVARCERFRSAPALLTPARRQTEGSRPTPLRTRVTGDPLGRKRPAAHKGSGVNVKEVGEISALP